MLDSPVIAYSLSHPYSRCSNPWQQSEVVTVRLIMVQFAPHDHRFNLHGSCLFRFVKASLSQITIVVLLTAWMGPNDLIIMYL